MRIFALSLIFYWLLVTFTYPKTLMVLLLCLSFLGQAMASTVMSYHMMGMTGMLGQEQTQNMTMMDHSQHNMAKVMAENSAESSDECCNKTCSCFTGGCSTVAAVMKDAVNSPILTVSAKIPSYACLAPSQHPTSLYRPPIIS